MKKILIVLVFVVVFSGAAFADHPDNQLGIGIIGGGYISFSGNGHSGGVGLSLKVPSLPIFWAFYLPSFNPLSLGISGDYYLIEGVLVPDINLHWFAGLGGWLTLGGFNSNLWLSLGARVPLGLSWHLVDMFEIFLNVAPSLGLQVTSPQGFYGFLPVELGIRLWF
jgi:hypothetical protein